jgi:hypothetical protein
VPTLHAEIFILKNTKISIFGGISKFRLWTDFGSFEQNLLQWQWLTACPNFG